MSWDGILGYLCVRTVDILRDTGARWSDGNTTKHRSMKYSDREFQVR